MRNTTKTGLIIVTVLLTTTLTACGTDETNREETTIEQAENKQMKIIELVENGDITEEEAAAMYADIADNTETKEEEMKRNLDNISDFTGLPSWAISVGMIEPTGLTFIPEDSSITEADGSYTDSFVAMYKGDSDKIFEEARSLAKELDLEISMDMETLLMADGNLGKYSVSLVVADNGDGVQLTYSGYETP